MIIHYQHTPTQAQSPNPCHNTCILPDVLRKSPYLPYLLTLYISDRVHHSSHRLLDNMVHLPASTLNYIFTDHSFRYIISIPILTKFKPFVFNNTCPWSFSVCIINRCISLKIRYIQHFCLKLDGTILQISQTIIKICINRS